MSYANRIQLQYSELLAARKHAESILDGLLNNNNNNLNRIKHLHSKYNSISLPESVKKEIEDIQKMEAEIKIELEQTVIALKSIDQRFLSQVRFIELQLDTNFPQ